MELISLGVVGIVVESASVARRRAAADATTIDVADVELCRPIPRIALELAALDAL